MPAKLDPAMIGKVALALGSGLTLRLAAQHAGVHDRTLYRWIARGRKAKSGVYRDLVVAIDAAEAQCAKQLLEVIRDTAPDRWQAAAWLLERRFGYKKDARPDQEAEVQIAAVAEAPSDEVGRLELAKSEVQQMRRLAQQGGSFVAAASMLRTELDIGKQIADEVRRAQEAEADGRDTDAIVGEIVSNLSALPDGVRHSILSTLAAQQVADA